MKKKSLIVLKSPFVNMMYPPPARERIEALTDLVGEGKTPDDIDPAVLAETHVLFSGWGAPVMTAELLAKMPKLELVLYAAGATDYMITPEFKERKIPLASAIAQNSRPVAEYVVAQIIMGLKRAMPLQRAYRAARSGITNHVSGAGIYNAKVGLVSLGNVARLTLERIRALDLDVDVIAYDPFLKPEEFERLGVKSCDLETLFSESDVISLHTPWLPQTEKLINGSLMSRMKQDAVFINTSRGAVVDEVGLLEVAQERPDVQFFLDVTWPEPPDKASPLFELENVFLTPHIAGSQTKECERMGQAMVDSCEAFLNGKPIPHLVKL